MATPSNRESISLAQVGLYAIALKGEFSPVSLQYVFDVGHLRDPIGHAAFKGKDGTDPLVREWILADKRVKGVIEQVQILAFDHIKNAGGRWLSIGLADTHGKWIAAALGEIIADQLAIDGYKVAVIHSWKMESGK